MSSSRSAGERQQLQGGRGKPAGASSASRAGSGGAKAAGGGKKGAEKREMDDPGEKDDLGLPTGRGGGYGIASAVANPGQMFMDTARWLESSEDTDPIKMLGCCCEDFKARKLKAPCVLGWLVLQALGIFSQFALLSEVTRHLEEYDQTLARNCGPEHQQHGVCLGPTWNFSYSGVLAFPPAGSDNSDYDFVIPTDQAFKFKTTSSPATFLVGVEPQVPHNNAHWRLSISATGPRTGDNTWRDKNLEAWFGTGRKFNVFSSRYFSGAGEWAASMNLKSKYDTTAQVYAYVVDSKLQHLEEIHNQKQCSFEKGWQNFNDRESGRHQTVLLTTRRATTFFLVLSVGCFLLMLRRFLLYVEGGKLLSRVVALKFVLQDLPQQVCIVGYIYSWYAVDGLRCQMCIFHPGHCDDEHPLHFSNLVLCILTLLSASSNQMLLTPKAKRIDEETECFLALSRVALFSVSILPFSTAMFFLTSSVLHFQSTVIYAASAVPTFVGWGTVFCVPMFSICEDEALI